MMFHAALACVGVLTLVAGGVRTWTVPCLALIALVAAAPAVFKREARMAPVHYVLLAAAAWQTLLLLPVPGVLSPWYAETRAFVWEALDAPPAWRPLAVNPAVAALDAARLWCTLLLVLVVAERAQHQRPTKLVWLTIVAAGVVQLLLGGAFINPNHQAAFWNMGWIAALCGTFFVRERWLRALLAVASAALLVGVAVTGSRAGVVAAALGGIVLFWRLRRDVGRRVGVIAFFLALSAIIGTSVVPDLRVHADEKTRVWKSAWDIAQRFPVGAGRGAFGLVFQHVREPDRERGRWDYVENEYLQTLVDYGPFAGALGLLALAWLLSELLKTSRWRVETAGVTAITVALAAHALFDFNWELAGVFVPMWLLIAVLSRPNNHALAPTAFVRTGRAAKYVYAAACVCVPLLTAYGVTQDPQRASAEQLVRTRPLDSFALVTLAYERPRDAMRWLNRAVYVDHDWKAPHIALARLFCTSGNKAQGRLELRLAEERSGDDGRDPAAITLLLSCIDAPGDEMDIGDDALPAVISAVKNDDSLRAIALRYDGDNPHVFRTLAPWARGKPEWQLLMERWPASDPLGKKRELAEQTQDFAALYAEDPSVGPRYVAALLEKNELDLAAKINAGLPEREQQLNRARIAAKRGRVLEALTAYRLWLSRAPKDAAAATEAALYAQRIGDKDAAADILDTSLRAAEHPDLRALQQRL